MSIYKIAGNTLYDADIHIIQDGVYFGSKPVTAGAYDVSFESTTPYGIIAVAKKADGQVLGYGDVVGLDDPGPADLVAALSGVKSVKHVSVTIPGGQADGVYTTTISAVDTSKTILLFTGCSCSTFDVQAMYSYMTLTNSTTVTARRWVGSFADHVANCCVVEFYGGIKSIQRGVIDVPRNTATKNTTINAVTTAKTFVTWGGACTEKPSADNKLRPGRLYLSSTTNLYYYSNCTSNYPRHLVAYEVVEWE